MLASCRWRFNKRTGGRSARHAVPVGEAAAHDRHPKHT
jgi:hypothetical protein